MAIPGFDPDTAALQTALEFLTGYVVEYALSVDNIFVFVVIFGYFAVPAAVPAPRAVLGHPRRARRARAIFIALGAGLLQRFDWVIWLFGAFLIVTGIKLLFGGEEAPSRAPRAEHRLRLPALRAGDRRVPRPDASSCARRAAATRRRCSWRCCSSR